MSPTSTVVSILLVETVAEHLDVRADSLAPDVHLGDDLGVDSLALLDLAMRVEDVFDVWLTDDQTQGVRTVGDLSDAVREAIARRDA
ncbi:MAG TPA: acyl carrier protein [Actinomycetales bacterium]|nr:acyl carrier protein [Actinomycetales bacterium]